MLADQERAEVTCPTCGHENLAHAKFCVECGASLVPTCVKCGTELPTGAKFCLECGHSVGIAAPSTGPAPGGEQLVSAPPLAGGPAAFANGRYQVVRFLGEGGKKRVYLAHDTKLDRDVAFALLKTEALDEEGMTRVRREAQAMARLGDHPHVVTVYDIGDEDGPSLRPGSGQPLGSGGPQPYLVSQYMAGGSLDRLLAESEEHRLPLEQALQIAGDICQALEHAHAQGIVHRDLKPGNVWLTAPGGQGLGARGQAGAEAPDTRSLTPDPRSLTPTTTPVVAKLGDFGLALSLDRSRLTQAGMMVGTVAYMAPEQALGGEVTALSDLYSLGAMLYELVTGRPPFVGDESVAIITQHLNTPPVAPSWHRQGLPLALEALILRLLEKDPTKRPQSAAEVRQILASIDQGQEPRGAPQAPGTPSAGGPAAPMYRRIFVGREQELRQLEAGFDAALSGQGALMAVVGEPGIGKTALCEQLATYTTLRGARTLVGHCYEPASGGSIPYLPFVEAMRSYVLSREPEGLKEDLGTGAGQVARIVSEIRDRIPQSEFRTPQSTDPEEERWRLLQAVASFLRNAASVQPILLVLEDLHWADRGTLDLLVNLARNLQGARLLVVATYRDVEVDRAHPLSATLAELRRTGDLPRVFLRGLTPDEVHRMINTLQGQEIRWSFAESVHRQTEGNPLFVQEVMRYLIEEGLVVRREGRWEGAWREDPNLPMPELRIPEGLRDVIGKRLTRLSASCNQVLTIGAVIGREFRLDVLQAVASQAEQELFAALEEASDVGVVEQRAAMGSGVVFRFAHAFFRQVLYEEVFVPRRIRLHQQIGRALEQLYAPGRRPGGKQGVPLAPSGARSAGRLADHAAELAEHFCQSTDHVDLEKALRYSELAAQRALQVYAYGEAVAHLQRALQAQEVLDPDDKGKRCDLLLAMGEAQMPLGEPRKVADLVAPEAFAVAEELGDLSQAGRACRMALEGLHREDVLNVGRPEFAQWAERADRWAPPGTVDRAYADIALGRVRVARRRVPEGVELLRGALALARQLDDRELLLTAAWQNIRVLDSYDFDQAFELAREFIDWPRAGVSNRTQGQILEFCGAALLVAGDRDRGEQALRELSSVAERTRDAFVEMNARSWQAVLAVFDGRLDDALRLRAEQIARAEELGSGVAFVERGSPRALILRGRANELLERPTGASLRALALSHAGRREEAAKGLQEALRNYLTEAGDLDPQAFWAFLAEVFEAATVLGDRRTISLLLPALERLPPVEGNRLTCMRRWAGAAAALLGDREQARAYYEQALELCQRIRYRPEIALIRLELAELLIDELRVTGYELRVHAETAELGTRNLEPETRREAAAHLDFAIAEFREMQMQPSLERALALQASLTA